MSFTLEWDEEDLKEALAPAKRTLVPEGEYNTSIDEFKIDLTKEHPKISMQLTITDGEQKNRKLWANYSLSPKAKYIFAKEIKKLEVDVKDHKDIDSLAEALNKLQGKKLEVYVKHTPDKADKDKIWSNVYINDALSDITGVKNAAPKLDQDEEIPF